MIIKQYSMVIKAEGTSSLLRGGWVHGTQLTRAVKGAHLCTPADGESQVRCVLTCPAMAMCNSFCSQKPGAGLPRLK